MNCWENENCVAEWIVLAAIFVDVSHNGRRFAFPNSKNQSSTFSSDTYYAIVMQLKIKNRLIRLLCAQ